jgi:hypothetical protein
MTAENAAIAARALGDEVAAESEETLPADVATGKAEAAAEEASAEATAATQSARSGNKQGKQKSNHRYRKKKQ